MRLNKKRLAALAMSAVMAASTMSYPVYAEEVTLDETPVTEAQADQEATSVAYRVDPSTIIFNPDYSVTWTEVAQDGSGVSYTESGTASTLKQTEATCEDPAYLWMTITIDGTVYNSGNTDDPTTAFVTAPALGHAWEIRDDEGYVVEYPNCTEDGTGYYYQVCSRCGEKDTNAIERVLEAEGHDFGENKTRYENLNNVEIVNGEPQLVDPLKDGTYDVVTYHVCQRYDRRNNVTCGYEEVVSTTTRTILAEKITKSEVTDQKGLADSVNLIGMLEEDVPAADKIELAKCTEDGKYQVTKFALNENDEWVPVSQKWVTVPAHHMETPVAIEFANEEDAAQCSVDAKTGEVTNNSCWKDITYYEVVHCTAAGCPNKHCDTDKYLCENTDLTEVKREEKVAVHTGDHIINTEVERQVKAEAAKEYADYALLETLAKDKASYIKLSANTATCTEDGTATVTFLCKVCKHEVKEITVKTKALGHDPAEAVEENVVPATCQALGSYDAVIYCDRCGLELVRRPVKTPRLAHTNEVSVSASGVGVDDTETDTTAYIKFFGNKVVDYDGESLKNIGGTFGYRYGHYKDEYAVWTGVYTNCANCNEHEVLLADYQDTTLTIVDCQKQKESGEAGTITLQATYTKADGTKITEVYSNIPYFSTMEAYMGRVEDIPLNGLNLDEDGVYRYYVNGEFASDFTGIVEYAGERFFVTNGVLAIEGNGLNEFGGEWYYLSQGQIQRSHTGLAEYDGQWFYIVNGKLDDTVNGLVPYNGGIFLFAEGRLVKEAMGLWQDFDGSWYYLSLGQVQTQHTGVVEYDGAFFYVRSGKLDTNYNGTVLYDGVRFNVVAGQLYDPVA